MGGNQIWQVQSGVWFGTGRLLSAQSTLSHLSRIPQLEGYFRVRVRVRVEK
jgi:hypothetical protein